MSPVYQAFNKKINAWVKYEFSKKGFKPIDVKQNEPLVPFKNIEIKGKRRWKKKKKNLKNLQENIRKS